MLVQLKTRHVSDAVSVWPHCKAGGYRLCTKSNHTISSREREELFDWGIDFMENHTNEPQHQPNADGADNNHGRDIVTVYINDTPYPVHQGRLDVSTIMQLNDIPITDVVYQLPDYLLLPNDGFVVVHGDERFKSGGSSGHSS